MINKRGIIRVDDRGAEGFFESNELERYKREALIAFDTLVNGTGKGSRFTGWINLPSTVTKSEIDSYKEIAQEWRDEVDVVVVIGIGGSYLGTKASIEALSNTFANMIKQSGWPAIVFAGQNLSQDYLAELSDLLKDKRSAAIVISKSGTTTEPAVAFRLVKKIIEDKYGKSEAAKKIVAVTDKESGALKQLSDNEGYRTFVIPDDVGGRYSVLTPVGLLPLAVAGIDIESLVKGAAEMEKECLIKDGSNPAVLYAALRNMLYSKGKRLEILVNYNPKLQYFAEWWKQLFGESEGKENKGIFPASVNFTTDLHSMGQYIQEGERFIFETVLDIVNPSRDVFIASESSDLDGLNYLEGKSIDYCNKMAMLGTKIAHIDGGVPNISIETDFLNEQSLGALFYFFEFSCGLSGYILGVNPFDQPGVEDYKNNMFALLGKPGYEELKKKLKNRL